MSRRIVAAHFTIFILIAGASISSAAPVAGSQQALVNSIEILYSARTNIIVNHQAVQDSESTRWAEDEFLLFLAYIDGRILHYCEQLRQKGGMQALAGLPCPDPSGENQESLSYTLGQTAPRTDEEKAATAEAEFQASLGEFDDYLLKEQEQVRQRLPKQREGASSTIMTDPRFRYPPSDETIKQNSGSAGQGGSDVETRTQPNGQTAGRSSGAGSTRPTRTLPSSGDKDFSESDDDIVARQLREAAEQWTDPEIKARLWEEYYQYKRGTQ